MVFQNKKPAAEVRVCNLSLHRHETSTVAFKQQQKQLLGRRLNKTRINLKVRNNEFVGNMHSQQQQRHQQPQPLPLVELSPFRKSVWRREKSLPDFYGRQQCEQLQPKDGDDKRQNDPNPRSRSLSNGIDKQNQHPMDLTPTEMFARLTAALHFPGGDFNSENGEPLHQNHHQGNNKNRCSTHPRAEFHHQSIGLWRTQDLIPSFVTRLERTKTSMPSFYKESSNYRGVGFYLGEDKRGTFVRSNSSSGHSSAQSNNVWNMNVRGGQMRQQVHRHPLLYLNPFDSYGHSYDAVRDTVQPFVNHSHSKVTTRKSFPFTTCHARELMLNAARHSNYPLRPVRQHCNQPQTQPHLLQQHAKDSFHPQTSCNSPHKFNSKLGAAKNSLEVLSSLGTPTKLEKSLVAEYEMNLERFRRDRCVTQPFDLRYLPSHYVSATMNLTRGEICLQEAREANKARRRKNLLTPLGGTPCSTSSQLLNTERGSSTTEGGNGISDSSALTLRKQHYFYVDPTMHQLDSVLAEESESHVFTDDDLGSASAVNAVLAKSTTKSAPSKLIKISKGDICPVKQDLMFATTSSCVGKIQQSILNDRLHKNDLTSTASVEKLIRQEDNATTYINLNDDADMVCAQDTATPVSVGGSSTSRAKTNLEYLNKLRTRGVPRSLQPYSYESPENDTKRNISLQVGPVNMDLHRDSNMENNKGSENDITVFDERSKITEALANHTAAKTYPKSRIDNDSTLQATVTRSSNAHSSVLNACRGDDIQKVPQHASTVVEIDSHFAHCQTEENQPAVESYRVQKNISTKEENIITKNEGFASPKETAQPKERSSNLKSLDSGVPCEIRCASENYIGSSNSYSYELPHNTGRSIKKSISAYEGRLFVPSLSTPRGETTDESAIPLGTPFTSGDSVTFAGTPLTNLDTSLEPLSENEAGGHSTSADNEDSGVSTTFLTTEDSRAELIEGVVFE